MSCHDGKVSTTTSNEDQPVLGQGDFQEQNFLDVAIVLHDTTVWHVHCSTDNPGGQSQLNAENNGNDPDLWKLPFDRALFGVSVVIGDSDSG